MAVTKIANVVEPEVFNPYVIERTMELAAIFQAGIAVRTPEFDRLASGGGRTVNMPFWGDLSGADEVLTDASPLSPGNIAADKDVAVILRRGRAWGANDLAANLAGDDPMRAIGDLVAGYWARRYQGTLISMLKGIFADSTMASLVHDISAGTGGAENIGASSFIDATQKLGDAKGQLTAVAMHSAVNAYLAKQNLIDYVHDSEGSPVVPTYMGKRVIIDDALTASNGVYTTYLFGAGAVAYGEGSPVGFVPTEVDRDSLAGEDYLINRHTFILHPRGVEFLSASVAGSSPTNAELENDANWARVYEVKNIPVVQFKHKIGS